MDGRRTAAAIRCPASTGPVAEVVEIQSGVISGLQRARLDAETPEVTLAQARKWTRDQRAAVRLGANPAAQQRAARAARQVSETIDTRPTVAARLAEWQANQPKPWKPRYYSEVARVVERIINPTLGSRALADVARGEWVQLISNVRTKGTPNGRRVAGTGTTISRPSPAQATMTYTVASSFLTYAENVGWIEQNPLPRKGKALVAPDVAPRQRTLNDTEIIAVWRASANYLPKTRAFIRLLVLSGARESEVAGIAVGELNNECAIWRIPGDRAKNRNPIAIPLCELAQTEIATVWPGAAVGASYRLLGTVAGGALSGFSKLKARLDRDLQAQGHQLAPWRWHDLRRSIRSTLSRLGTDPRIAERALNHISGTKLERTYDTHSYTQEISAALRAWQAHVTALLGANVLPFSRATA
jgi:integrase